jgi:hypothetical protein
MAGDCFAYEALDDDIKCIYYFLYFKSVFFKKLFF